MLLNKRHIPTLLFTSTLAAGVSFGTSAEQLPATPHQAETLDAVDTKRAPRPETEQRMPVAEHQRDALKMDQAGTAESDEDLSRRLEKLRTYTAMQREEAIEEARAVLTAIDARIEGLQARLANSGDQITTRARERMTASLDALQVQRQELSEWMGGLMHSSAQAWQHVQNGFVDAYNAFADQLDKAEKAF